MFRGRNIFTEKATIPKIILTLGFSPCLYVYYSLYTLSPINIIQAPMFKH